MAKEPAKNLSLWNWVLLHSEAALALAVIMVLVVLVIPLPLWLLDLLLTANIAIAFIILMITLSSGEALDFSTFPSLLLFVTLFRLSLNVASTRLILLRGSAGQVITAFGNFVVGGEIVVGIVVFLILVIIQFVVITKGSSRISEVAARFTLDSMLGNQMAIDSDLNAKIITPEEARVRREKLARQAEFYGSMDGASKFVRGDAVAGIFITLVNIIGGIIIGVSRDMTIGQAVETYTVLTVGDGLVAQIPSLIIATAAGVLTTKASTKTNLSVDLTRQMLAQPRAMGLASLILMGFGIVPGLPKLPFFLMATLFGGMYWATKDGGGASSEPDSRSQPVPEPAAEPEPVHGLLKVDRVSIEVSSQLVMLVDSRSGSDFMQKIESIRREFARRFGFVLPPVRVMDNLELPARAYCIKIKGQEVSRAELMPEHLMAMDPGLVAEPIEGVETQEPVFGLPARWIEPSQKEAAEVAGYTVVDPGSVLITHLCETVKADAHEILSRQDVQELLEHLKETAPAIVEELTPQVMPLGGVQKVLQNLLREGIPIVDLATILEAIVDRAALCNNDTELLTEYVRQELARTICAQCKAEDGKIHAIRLDPGLEHTLVSCVKRTPDGREDLLAAPDLLQPFLERLTQTVATALGACRDVVLLVPGALRRHVRQLLQPPLGRVPTLSYEEMLPTVAIEWAGTVDLAGATPATGGA